MKLRYIIFADDDADDLEQITGYFKQYNPSVAVLEFMDGAEVLNFLETNATNGNAPLLIVLDINMPRMNGIDTLRVIRNHNRFQHLPVVMFTCSANENDEEVCNHLGASWACKTSSSDGARQTARVLAEFCELQVGS